ncbi:hypothetical protein [Streptomyces sp. NPDC055058]
METVQADRGFAGALANVAATAVHLGSVRTQGPVTRDSNGCGVNKSGYAQVADGKKMINSDARPGPIGLVTGRASPVWCAVRQHGEHRSITAHHEERGLTVTKFSGRLKQRIGVVAAVAVATTLAGSVPAHAEGSRTTYIKAWANEKESSRWHDSHKDRNSTKVQFKSCVTDRGSGFQAPLTLYRVKSLAKDPGYGKKTNTCNTSNWGEMKTVGDYYFKYHATGYVITVNTVKVSW